MKKIKQLSFIQTALVVFFGSAFLILSLFYEQASAAVEPGCYASSTAGSTKNITEASCPTEEQSQVDEDQVCFVTSVGSGGQLPYVQTDCNLLNLGDTALSNPDSTGENGNEPAESLFMIGEDVPGEHYCGKGEKQVKISFDIGCLGNAYSGDQYNPILDMLFALLRFVSVGVGLVVTGSIVWAGIQYSTSRGNPQGTEAALKRVSNAVIALLIYIFAWAILNFLVPGGLFI